METYAMTNNQNDTVVFSVDGNFAAVSGSRIKIEAAREMFKSYRKNGYELVAWVAESPLMVAKAVFQSRNQWTSGESVWIDPMHYLKNESGSVHLVSTSKTEKSVLIGVLTENGWTLSRNLK